MSGVKSVKRVKLNPPSDVTIQQGSKGSCRVERVMKFCDQVPAQPCALFPQKRKIFTLDEYSAHLDPAVKESLRKRCYILFIVSGGITGDLQVTDTDLHHPYHKALLMIEKLREHPDKIPSLNKDEITKMCKAVFTETLAKADISLFFKKNSWWFGRSPGLQ